VRGVVFRRMPKCLMDSPLAAKGIPQIVSRPEIALGFPSSNPWDLATFFLFLFFFGKGAVTKECLQQQQPRWAHALATQHGARLYDL
jgi:hypothetical protein